MITNFHSFMPFQDGGRNPVYQVREYGYQQRMAQECDCELTLLSYNAGKFIPETPFNYGIFVGEFNNKIQNMFNTGKSTHSLFSGLIEIPMCCSVINYQCFRRYLKQRDMVTIHQKKFPNVQSHIQNYPHVFDDLAHLYKTLFSLELIQQQFHKNENEDWFLMPTASITKVIPQLLYTEIVDNNILFNKEKQWTEKITYGVHALVQKYNMQHVNDDNIKIIQKALRKVKLTELAKNKKVISEKLENILNNYKCRMVIY